MEEKNEEKTEKTDLKDKVGPIPYEHEGYHYRGNKKGFRVALVVVLSLLGLWIVNFIIDWWSVNTNTKPVAPITTPATAPVASTIPVVSVVAPATPVEPAAPVTTVEPAAAPAVPIVKVMEAKEISEKLAVVQKGEGIEHALIRQLIAVPEVYGFRGDTENKKAVKKWAQTKAHQIAILAGYVNHKTGEEARVKGPGGNVAYVLQVQDDSKISIAQSCKNKEGNFPNQGSELIKFQETVKDYQSAVFIGNKLQPYEYLWKKG